MSEADDMARRYLTLWTQYLTTLLADPRTLEMVKRWHALASQFSYRGSEAPSADQPAPAWPPFLVPFGLPAARPGSPAPNAEGTAEIAVLMRRIDELESRIAVLERQRTPRRSRRGVRAATAPKLS